MKTLSLLTFWITFFLLFGTTTLAQNSFETWKENYEKGSKAFEEKKYDEAKSFLQKAYTIAKTSFNKNDKKFSDTAYILGMTNYGSKNYKQALSLLEESLGFTELNNKSLRLNYSIRFRETGGIYRLTGDYIKAKEKLLRSLEIIKNSLGSEDIEYGRSLLSITPIYRKLGEFNNALYAIQKAITIFKIQLGEDSSEYISALTNLSQIYTETGNYSDAIRIQTKALDLYSESDKKSDSFAGSLFALSRLYHKLNDYDEEIHILLKVKDILDETHRGYIAADNNLGQAYDRIGNYEKALFFTLEAVDKTKKEESNYAGRLQNLAFIYAELGEFKKALEIYNKALIARENKLGKDHHLYGKLQNNIGKLHFQMGNISEAQKLFEEAKDNFLKTFDENHPIYGYYLNDYANTFLKQGDYEEAIKLLKQNIALDSINKRIKRQEFFNKQFSLANAYNESEAFTKALPLLENSIYSLKNEIGKDHIINGKILKSLSETYLGLDEVDKAIPIIHSTNKILLTQLDKVFKFRSEKEKQSFLKIVKKNFDDIQSVAFHLNQSNKQLNDVNLNNQIMLKGLLLNNSKNILTGLSTLKDSSINNRILNYRSLKTNLTRTLSIPFEERLIDIDSLKDVINTKEVELVKLYNFSFKNENTFTGNWKTSQSNLNKADLAIEFSHFKLKTHNKITDSIIYVAYLYKSEWDSPKMIPLFEENELKNITLSLSTNKLYSSDKLYNLICKPIETFLESSKTIYYAPSGLLNQISFAAILQDTASVLVEDYNLVQLSNTGLLASKQPKPQATNALFIGGVTYDYFNPISNTKNTSYTYLNSENLKKSRGTKSRGESWDYLPATLREVEKLQALLNSKQKINYKLTAEKASEAAFKKLSGNSPNLLHIATHGFFYENIDSKPINNFNLSTEDQYRLSEDPLLRSGLLLAGANYTWKHGYNSNEQEDGILTALEISNLDLSNTDMVVLSACETGLGDIDGSEGVYGLQRAFKMAGVNIIVMSLWQVPDKETAEFMNLFYSDWLSNTNVKKAFNKAQRVMQSKYSSEPEKWAAFVLFE